VSRRLVGRLDDVWEVDLIDRVLRMRSLWISSRSWNSAVSVCGYCERGKSSQLAAALLRNPSSATISEDGILGPWMNSVCCADHPCECAD